MIRALSIVVATLLLLYMAAVAFFFRDVKEDGLCEGLQIGLRDSLDKHFVTEGDVIYMLKTAKLFPVEQPMNEINTEKIEQELMTNEMISKIEAFKTPSKNIKLEIEQKMPILRVNSTSGNYYIDNMGSVMPLSRHYVAHVLVASGYINKEFAMNELYHFVQFLQDNEFWDNQIDQIYVDADQEVELIPLVGNHKILLGSFDDYQKKLDNLKLFYEQAIPKVGWEKYSLINLKYRNQIVCTKR